MSHSADVIESWRRTEADLRAVLSLAGITAQARWLVEELLDHNELGVAFEVLVQEFLEIGAPLPSTIRARLADAVSRLGMADSTDWQRLVSLAG